jgi:hypothetical protein
MEEERRAEASACTWPSLFNKYCFQRAQADMEIEQTRKAAELQVNETNTAPDFFRTNTSLAKKSRAIGGRNRRNTEEK